MRRGCAPLSLAILLLIIGVLAIQYRSSEPRPEFLFINELASELRDENVARIAVENDEVEIIFRDGTRAFTRKEGNRSLVEQLLDLGVPEELLSSKSVQIEVKDSGIFGMTGLFPFAIIGGVGFVVGALVMLAIARAGFFGLKDWLLKK